mgnify:CR=1 FL=1
MGYCFSGVFVVFCVLPLQFRVQACVRTTCAPRCSPCLAYTDATRKESGAAPREGTGSQNPNSPCRRYGSGGLFYSVLFLTQSPVAESPPSAQTFCWIYTPKAGLSPRKPWCAHLRPKSLAVVSISVARAWSTQPMQHRRSHAPQSCPWVSRFPYDAFAPRL